VWKSNENKILTPAGARPQSKKRSSSFWPSSNWRFGDNRRQALEKGGLYKAEETLVASTEDRGRIGGGNHRKRGPETWHEGKNMYERQRRAETSCKRNGKGKCFRMRRKQLEEERKGEKKQIANCGKKGTPEGKGGGKDSWGLTAKSSVRGDFHVKSSTFLFYLGPVASGGIEKGRKNLPSRGWV